ncbi:MAG: hypothetical protein Q8M16_24430 [Pirellulaceae bacterium]|nr:hypothetical protein [Pirellulaceae bacterium]
MNQWNPEFFAEAMAYGGVLAIGLLLGALAATMYFRPNLVAMIAQGKAIGFLAIGVGIMVWGTISMSVGGPFDQPFDWVNVIRTPAEAIAWGAGLITAGVAFLVFSFVGFGRSRA